MTGCSWPSYSSARTARWWRPGPRATTARPSDRHRLPGTNQVERFQGGLAAEGGPAGEQLVENRPEGVDVRPWADGLGPAGRLLGGHVTGRAEDRPGPGLAGVLVQQPGQPE